MLRYDTIGAGETYPVERGNRILRETLVPAARPVGARIERERGAAAATYLDRPRFLWVRTARTLRTMTSADLGNGATVQNVGMTGTEPYTFVVPFPGILRRISCRDSEYLTSDAALLAFYALRIRVRVLNAAGVVQRTIMDGTTSHTIPFDVRDLEESILGASSEKLEVAALNSSFAVVSSILNVRFEFALNLTSLGV